MKKNLLLIIAVLSFSFLNAQVNDKAGAMRLVIKNSTAIGLTARELDNLIVTDAYYDKIAGTQMVYIQQTFKGIPVYNQLKVLAFKHELPVSNAGSFITSIEKKVNLQDGHPVVSPGSAVQAALADKKFISSQIPQVIAQHDDRNEYVFGELGVSRENITAKLTWVPVQDGRKLLLAWQVYIIPITTPDYWMIKVDAKSNRILGADNYTSYCNWDAPEKYFFKHNSRNNSGATDNLFDFCKSNQPLPQPLTNSPLIVNNASYRVVPFPAESPVHPGGTPAVVNNPWTAIPGNATSLKWQSNGTTDFTITRSNNVLAQEDRDDNNGTGFSPATTTTPDYTFNFVPNFTVVATQTAPVQNQQFNITNLFYWNNLAHDITYQYGFDEVSGNFQDNNQGRGGLGNDYVYADAQDGGGTNNANFATPPDGSNPRMQMYLWNGNPQKDGDVDNGVIVHEFGHGISTRLTGGPSNSGCLGSAEQMGEGWSDYYCLMYTQDWVNSNLNTGFNTPRPIGTYVIGQTPTGSGIRNQKYCTNFAVNNEVYAATISNESHNRGEIWCATLWDMTWNIINQVGVINPNIIDAAAPGGNSIALKLVTEGLRLQPCSPGFIDGRDAILQADQILYGGTYECAIREAFRRRGMGAFASQGSSESVTDQTPDYTAGGASFTLTQNGTTQVPEGGLITYTNIVTTTGCAPISNFLLTDTLPANVTYVSGGTYNSATRVVSFAVNMAAAQSQNFTFIVQINTGAYFPTVSLFEDNVTTPTVPAATWTTNSTTTTNWVVSNARSHSAPASYFSEELDVTSDQKLFTSNAIALGSAPPPLSFWHFYNLESTYDGGVLEISTDGGTVWTDLQPHIILNGYTATMDASTLLAGRRAWSGSTNNKFIKTKVDLSSYANQNVKIRFRMTSDVGTNPEGWYIDDIAIKNQAVVEMTSNFFTDAGVKVATSDTVTIILPPPACAAVTVTAQPVSTNVCIGNDATLTVTADGDTPSFQWQVSTDGGLTFTNIPGATASTLTLTSVTASMNNYQYNVVVTNGCPSNATSGIAILTVSDPANITAQPANFTTCAGSDANFTVGVSGSANTYQWQVSSNGVDYTDIPGATSPTLMLTGVTAMMNNNFYHVVITSCSPAALTSDNVLLTVNIPASFTLQPSNVTACQGTDAVFTTQADGTNVIYQWQVSTDGGINFTDIPGATSATLTVSAVNPAFNNYQYHVVITNVCTASVVSTNSVLTVSNIAIITSQPVSTTACEGSSISFNTSASGTGYQWEVSTDGVNFTPVPGATSPILILSNVTLSMNGDQYHLIVSTCGPGSATSNNVTLSVVSPAAITSQPNDQSVCEGSNVDFTVAASGTSISYQWEVSTDGGISYNPVPGANGPVLTLPGVNVNMDGYLYRAVLSNFCTVNFTSNAVVLHVSLLTAISAQPADMDDICEGSGAVFSVTAIGSGLSYQWQLSTDNGVTFTDIQGATSSVLTIANVSFAMNNNRYRVLVNGCNDLTSSEAVLTVNPLPVVTITASPYTNLNSNQTTTLTATSTPPATAFSWYKNDVLVAGASSNTLVLSFADTGSYRAAVTDAFNCTGVSNKLLIGVSATTFIYPNPNNGHFWVHYPGFELNGKPRIITLFDGKGARVLQQSYAVITGDMEVHAEKLSSGVYALVLTNASGEVLGTGKVIIGR